MTAPLEAEVLLAISREREGYRESRSAAWYGYADGDGWGALLFASTLFRGQPMRYLPMLPSIARGLEPKKGQLSERSPRDQALLFLRLTQSWWFARELDYHPITSHATTQGLKVNRLALAQHYGIPTGYLDLTDDFDVGAFFATCVETRHGWEPIDDGIGVVYRVDLNGSFENPFGAYEVLGPQLLPRPSEQCGWVAELPASHAFDGWPGVSLLLFRQQCSVGEYFLRRFDGGAALFPLDPLAVVATEIKESGEIPSEFIERAIESFVTDPLGILPEQVPAIRRELSSMTRISGYRRVLSDEQVSGLMSDFEWRSRMLSEIKATWRFVR